MKSMSRGRSSGGAGGAVGDTLDPDAMRALVRQYTDLGQWTGALFWADKALALRGGPAECATMAAGADAIWLVAQSLIARGEWHRALHAITSRDLHKTHLLCLHAAVRAALSASEPAQALQLLNDIEPETLQHNSTEIQKHRAVAAVYVCKGCALSSLERRGPAVEALITALRHDVACYEALDMLLEHHAHTVQQDEALLESLPIESQCSGAEAALLRDMYRTCVDRHGSPANRPHPDSRYETSLSLVRTHSADAAAWRARQLLHRCEFEPCLRLLDTVDPWFCAELRVACLVELKRAPALFAFAHTLVDRYPHSATAWFAVGCYYLLIGKNEFARRYLAKAKSLDPGAGHVWLAYGHSFAADNEHDQAMAAYFKSSQLLPGCHLPFLYISVECSLLNNSAMAERFLARAAGLAPTDQQKERAELSRLAAGEGLAARLDPHVTHEAGAAAFATGDYHTAELLFRRALHDVQAAHGGSVPERWHALLDNLGHACRKNGKCEEALQFHERALACRPAHPSTYAAMGLCLALLGRVERAVDVLHAALSKEPDDAVSLSLLNYLIDQFADATGDDAVPAFPFPAVTLDIDNVVGAAETTGVASVDITRHSDMSMSFD